MKSIIKVMTLVVLFAAVNLFAQNDKDYSKYPGYVDFGNLTKFEKGDNVTEVNIEENLLKMVGKMAEGEDNALSEMLSGLKLVKVSSFKTDSSDANAIMSKISEVDKKLTSENWNRIVKAKTSRSYSNVYIKTSPDGKSIQGLAVTNFEKNGKASFVNIVGTINLETIGKLGKKFDIPSLDKIKKHKSEDKDEK
jgi:hypothetical protein